MPDQLNLFGSDPPPPPGPPANSPKKHQLFCAIRLPSDVTGRVLDLRNGLCQELGLKGAAVAGTRLHATLHPFGHFDVVPEDYVDRLCRLLATVEQKPFLVTFDVVRSYATIVLAPRVENEALNALSQAIGRAAGFKGRWSFSPHITLHYAKQRIPDRDIDPINWMVNEFVLIDSVQGETTHNLLRRFPLRG